MFEAAYPNVKIHQDQTEAFSELDEGIQAVRGAGHDDQSDAGTDMFEMDEEPAAQLYSAMNALRLAQGVGLGLMGPGCASACRRGEPACVCTACICRCVVGHFSTIYMVYQNYINL